MYWPLIIQSLTFFPPVCVGCFKLKKKCKLGVCVKVPVWDGCCDKVTDPACISHNTACAALKKPLELALKAAKETVDKSRKSLDAAKGALSAAQGVVDGAKKSLDAAVASLSAVRKTYRVGVEAISAINKFAQNNKQIINIHEMYFKVELSVANGGRFQCRVKGVLMGENINVNLDFDIRNPLKIAKLLGDRAISGLSKFIG